MKSEEHFELRIWDPNGPTPASNQAEPQPYQVEIEDLISMNTSEFRAIAYAYAKENIVADDVRELFLRTLSSAEIRDGEHTSERLLQELMANSHRSIAAIIEMFLFQCFGIVRKKAA